MIVQTYLGYFSPFKWNQIRMLYFMRRCPDHQFSKPVFGEKISKLWDVCLLIADSANRGMNYKGLGFCISWTI